MSSFAARIRVAEGADDLALVRGVRHEVFIAEQGVPEELEYDDLDATSEHLLAVGPEGEPLGTARLIHGPQALALTGGTAGRVLLEQARGGEGGARHRAGRRAGPRRRGGRARAGRP